VTEGIHPATGNRQPATGDGEPATGSRLGAPKLPREAAHAVVGRRAPWLVGACLLLASAVGLQGVTLRQRPEHDLPAVLYLQSPAVASRAVLGFDALAADMYWLRALQHFGATRLRDHGAKRFENLYPFLDLATSLDPRFNVAYRFGAIFLSEQPPGGPGRTDQAIALLEKGVRHNPQRWEYYQDIGFVHYWWTGDYGKAADAFSRGAAVPGSPWWLKSLAAVTLTQGGDRRTSRLLWQALAQSPDNEFLQRDARRRLTQLDALDQIDELTALVDRARAAGVTAPWSWPLLFQQGLLRVPIDPTGAPFEIDMTTGRIGLSRQSPLWPLPVEPRRRSNIQTKDVR
jgi:tetratricopeptide (TPR) repeat protein